MHRTVIDTDAIARVLIEYFEGREHELFTASPFAYLAGYKPDLPMNLAYEAVDKTHQILYGLSSLN